MNRVVVTGIGVVSPVGNGRETFWRNLTAGTSGLGPITLFDASAFPVRIGGEVKGLDLADLGRRFPEAARERDRKVWLGLAAAEEALADAGFANGDLRQAALHVGVGLEVFFLEDVTAAATEADMGRALTRSILLDAGREPLQTPLDRLGQVLGDHYGIFGGRYTNCSACAAGAQVVGEALRDLQEGDCAVALAGAADSMLNPLGVGGFSLLRVLSTENDRPQTACRPFDASREGTVLGEGSAFLVLETLDHARARGAAIYAEVLGYGASMDAFRVSDPEPSGRGAVLAMTKAVADAGLRPEDVDCVNAHGTGTPKNDAVETAAVKEVLGDRARRIPVHAVKSMTGHMIAASGAVEAAAAVLTLRTGTVPPTINLRTPDPECDLDYVADGPRPFDGRTVLANSFGFGGQNAALLFGRYER
ncbi:MAG TPA: beta-ketoacyl-[acyl-carrier-protein] synthase family protein [Phycisphaerae bacterium]|nr:beta-ketoacyl-[acyl-carrier-protein] synthase family protein [Phycisphaerae bacterium]